MATNLSSSAQRHDAHSTTEHGNWSTKRIAITALFCAVAAVSKLFLEFPILPGVTFKSVYDAKFSDDGTLILLPGEERGTYVLYTVNYDPDLSAVPASAGNAEEETWTCENGHTGLTSAFCPECGAKKPEE